MFPGGQGVQEVGIELDRGTPGKLGNPGEGVLLQEPGPVVQLDPDTPGEVPPCPNGLGIASPLCPGGSVKQNCPGGP